MTILAFNKKKLATSADVFENVTRINHNLMTACLEPNYLAGSSFIYDQYV